MFLAILETVDIQSLDALLALGVLHPAIEPPTALFAEQLFLQHAQHQIGGAERLPSLVVGASVVDGVGNVHEGIKAYQVRGAEGRTLGVPDQRAGQEVDLLDGEVQLLHGTHDVQHAEDSDTVGDEVGRVACDDDALPQSPVDEVLESGRDSGIRRRTGDDLEQVKVARRIEEVGPEKVTAEFVVKVLHHGVDGQPRCVGADDGSGFAMLGRPRENLALDVKVFLDDLDDPVGLGDALPVILEITHFDLRGEVLDEERRGPRLQSSAQGIVAKTVAHDRVIESEALGRFLWRQLTGYDVEHDRGDAGIG